MTLLRWATGRRIRVRRLAAAAWRRSISLSGSAIVSSVLVAVLDALAARAAAQEIQRRVVGDAEQPALDVGERAGMREGLDRLDQRLLQHVLAVDHRAGHAGAIAMQPRPQLGQEPLELCLAGRSCLPLMPGTTFGRGQRIRKEGDFFRESFAAGRSSSRTATPEETHTMKWTLVRYRAKPERADENQRLSAAVFDELKDKAPAGLRYAVFRLPDDTFVHIAMSDDGGPAAVELRELPRLPEGHPRALRRAAAAGRARHRRQLRHACLKGRNGHAARHRLRRGVAGGPPGAAGRGKEARRAARAGSSSGAARCPGRRSTRPMPSTRRPAGRRSASCSRAAGG